MAVQISNLGSLTVLGPVALIITTHTVMIIMLFLVHLCQTFLFRLDSKLPNSIICVFFLYHLWHLALLPFTEPTRRCKVLTEMGLLAGIHRFHVCKERRTLSKCSWWFQKFAFPLVKRSKQSVIRFQTIVWQ